MSYEFHVCRYIFEMYMSGKIHFDLCISPCKLIEFSDLRNFWHTPKLSFGQKNDFFHQNSKSSKIVQKWWENIPDKPQTLYFHKLIELCEYDKYFLKKVGKCNLGTLIFTYHGRLIFSFFSSFSLIVLKVWILCLFEYLWLFRARGGDRNFQIS